MRVVLVGSDAERQRLKDRLGPVRIDVVAEFGSLQEARQWPGTSDAILIAPEHSDAARSHPRRERLTPREMEVLELIAEGLPNKVIAMRLAISDQTVKFHVASICGKLGARNRTAAVRVALATGLIAV